jgi:hypothetical protein
VRFSDFDDVDVLRRALSEFQGEFAWELVRRDGRSAGGGSLRRREEGDEAVAHFFRKETYDAVVGKIGGGARGRFRARGATQRGDGFEADDAPTMGAAAAAAAAARSAAAAALARAGGRAGPRVPGAFGKEKGKEKAETRPALSRRGTTKTTRTRIRTTYRTRLVRWGRIRRLKTSCRLFL